MQTLEALSRKIKSARELGEIVRTMKTLAAVNIRHYEKAAESVDEYSRTVEMGFQVVLGKGPVEALAEPVGTAGVVAVVFGSDTGLCGGFNDRVARHAIDELYSGERAAGKKAILCVGGRAEAAVSEKGHGVEETFTVPDSISGISTGVESLVLALEERIEAGTGAEVMLFFNSLVSTSSYGPETLRLLPLDRTWLDSLRSKKWPTRVLPAFTMKRTELFSALVRQYIFVSLYRAFAQSMASENAARLASMQSAERNIEERLEELNSVFRTQRQSEITSELLDIVSGYQALSEEEEPAPAED